MVRFKFDARQPDLWRLRQVIFQRLREQTDWKHVDSDPTGAFAKYIELDPPRYDDKQIFEASVGEVFWQLALEGVITPGLGTSTSNMTFPWFRVTDHGKRVLADREYVPQDLPGYLQLLREHIPNADPTVLAYLTESLETYVRNSLVASTVMLGVAAERVFDLLCESVVSALRDRGERQQFQDLLKRNAMKPKLDWLSRKFEAVRSVRPQRVRGFPENVSITVTAIYDLIRVQRNEFGHPSDTPPRPSRAQAHAHLLVFPTYYERVEALRTLIRGKRI